MFENQLKTGDYIPHFILNNEMHLPVDVSLIKGKYLILYFYPKDDTPGCVREACSFRDAFGDLVDAGAVVFGVSADNPASHARFKAKYNLPFSLLSDTSNELRKLLGVPSDLFGLLPGRVTYIFDPEGQLIHTINSQLSPAKHVKEALEVLKNGA